MITDSGGFYQESLAFYGERAYGNGCQMCDDGTFVRKAPGRRKDDCKPCPEGMITCFNQYITKLYSYISVRNHSKLRKKHEIDASYDASLISEWWIIFPNNFFEQFI
jgi:hypothetical protein